MVSKPTSMLPLSDALSSNLLFQLTTFLNSTYNAVKFLICGIASSVQIADALLIWSSRIFE
jgi:hypothetical protein